MQTSAIIRFVFTGALVSMTRAEAWDLVKLIGGIPSDYVSNKTNYLILGKLRKDNSRKLTKARQLNEAGNRIQIISESEFVSLVWTNISDALTAMDHESA